MCVPGGTLIFVPSIQGYLSDRGTLDKQEVLFGGCSLLFLLLHFFGRKVAWSWKVVVLCHPCDRSLLFGCHLLSLAFLEGGLAGHRRVGTRRPG